MLETNELQISDCTLQEFIQIAARFGSRSFGYAVTPNADHLIRFRDDPSFRACYRLATFVLFDSRFLAILLRAMVGQRLPLCPGSDLTAGLLKSVISTGDKVLLVGCTQAQVEVLETKFHLSGLQHHNPPMDFINDAAALETCLQFIEHASPFRFCFLAVGSPQQEQLACLLKERGRVRGLALCVGGALNYLTGIERRAPHWMQRSGLEWLHRLLSDPPRMTQRYLVRGPRIFFLLPRMKLQLRPVAPTEDAPARRLSYRAEASSPADTGNVTGPGR